MASTFESIISNAINGSNDVYRATAVAAALELVAARITSPTLKQAQLSEEMDNLSKYADQIQQALKQK